MNTRTEDVTNHLHEAHDSLADAGMEGRRAKRAAIDSIQEEWSRLKAELNDLSNNGVLSKTPELQATLERLRENVNHASEVIGETSRHASRRIARVATDADDYVHEAPWKVVTMAAVAGVAVGLLIARR